MKSDTSFQRHTIDDIFYETPKYTNTSLSRNSNLVYKIYQSIKFRM